MSSFGDATQQKKGLGEKSKPFFCFFFAAPTTENKYQGKTGFIKNKKPALNYEGRFAESFQEKVSVKSAIVCCGILIIFNISL